jgi:voltage-gated potassium channel
VGYGDLVPTTPASRIFAVFVVLLGYGVLSLVTAALAARWVETEERRIEREILHDMRREMAAVRAELATLREALPEKSEGQAV